MDAFIFIAMDTQKRKIAHWLEKHSNRAQIFAECAIIFKYKSQHNTYNIVKCISSKENPEHDSLQIRDFHQKQAENHCQGKLIRLPYYPVLSGIIHYFQKDFNLL